VAAQRHDQALFPAKPEIAPLGDHGLGPSRKKLSSRQEFSILRYLHDTLPLTLTTYGEVAMQQAITAICGQRFSLST
jgi:hypothetical protein